MLARHLVKPTRDETAISIAKSYIGRAYLGIPFSDDDLREVVTHVEAAYGTFDDRPDQFYAVVGAVALQAAMHATRYGAFGYDDESVIAGRSSIRYWLDNSFGENNLGARFVKRVAKLPPQSFVMDVAPEPKSSARCCKGPGPKHKFGVGEPRLSLTTWGPAQQATGGVVTKHIETCCLDAACVTYFEARTGVSIADAVPAEHLSAEARAAVEARKAELLTARSEGAPPFANAPPKSDACFPKDRKHEPTHYESGVNPWGELEIDIERVIAEGDRRAAELEQQAVLHPYNETKRVREARDEALEHRKKRYRPTLDAHKDAVVNADEPLCAYVFESGPSGESGPFRCPYDRKSESPFCSQCAIMVETLGAE